MAVGGAAIIAALNAQRLVRKHEEERREREKERQEQTQKKKNKPR